MVISDAMRTPPEPAGLTIAAMSVTVAATVVRMNIA